MEKDAYLETASNNFPTELQFWFKEVKSESILLAIGADCPVHPLNKIDKLTTCE